MAVLMRITAFLDERMKEEMKIYDGAGSARSVF